MPKISIIIPVYKYIRLKNIFSVVLVAYLNKLLMILMSSRNRAKQSLQIALMTV